jgi:hypothetical protein
MVRRKRKLIQWIVRFLAGILILVFAITLGFYLARGLIMKKALSYLNARQPGELQMEQINLVPFMDFPDVVLQLRNISYYERDPHPDSLYQEPILNLNEVFVSLDVVDLIRGNIRVSAARFRDGFVRVEVYKDSVTNLEHALGIRFGSGTETDTLAEQKKWNVELERIRMENLLALYFDRTSGDSANILVGELGSRLSYLPDQIRAGIKLEMDINNIKYLRYRLENKEDIRFESQVSIDTKQKVAEIWPSILEIAGLTFETRGRYEYHSGPYVDLDFRAKSTGLDVLNFIFLGILDLDEIEQVGGGSIRLSGKVVGGFDGQIPVITVNGMADGIGFRIRSIRRDVTDISFRLYATNGDRVDLSRARVRLENFNARFPEGSLRGDISAANRMIPEIDLRLEGELELSGLEQMIRWDLLEALSGHLSLKAGLKGVLDRRKDDLLADIGVLTVETENVGIILGPDTIRDLNGELYLQGHSIGTKHLSLDYNGNRANIEVLLENYLDHLLGIEKDIHAKISLNSELIYPGRLLKDTLVSSLVGDSLTGLHFSAGASISGDELDDFLEKDSIPVIHMNLDSFGVKLPYYSDISRMKAGLTLERDTLKLHFLEGTIGESAFRFSGAVAGYRSLLRQDSGASVGLGYELSSDLMRAEDLLVYRNASLLPETYQEEYLENFRLEGSLQLPVDGLVHDSVDLDFGLDIQDLGWNFRYYPLVFDDFHGRIGKKENELVIDELQGKIGESDLGMQALVGNYRDTLRKNLYGNIVLKSDLLDLNELLNYQLPESMHDSTGTDSAGVREPPRLDQIDYPDFEFNVDIGELRYGKNKVFGMNGKLRSSTHGIFYLDHLEVSGESGGTMQFNGQFSVASPDIYNFSAELELENVNMDDLTIEMQSGDQVYTLRDNFDGRVSASGLAEIFITPDLKLDMTTTTAVFNVQVNDGALVNFTPLEAVARYLDNKDLHNVRFSTLRNSFTLMDSKIIIPLMVVESTVGQLLIEGEQGLDNSYLYLVHVPTGLVREAAKSRLSESEDDGGEDEIQRMKMGTFMMLTPWSDGVESGVRLGDKRDKYR